MTKTKQILRYRYYKKWLDISIPSCYILFSTFYKSHAFRSVSANNISIGNYPIFEFYYYKTLKLYSINLFQLDMNLTGLAVLICFLALGFVLVTSYGLDMVVSHFIFIFLKMKKKVEYVFFIF